MLSVSAGEFETRLLREGLNGIVKLAGGGREDTNLASLSAGTGHLMPGVEDAVSKDALIGSAEKMSTVSPS